MDIKRGALYTLLILIVPATAFAGGLVGDLNLDNTVTYEDLQILAGRWLSPGNCSEFGLIAHWKLDESIEATAADASAFARDGIVHGELLWRPDGGKIGGSLELDGFEDYVEIPGFKGVTGSARRTCTAWIRTPEVNGEIISWGELGVPSHRWIVLVEAAGLLRVEVGAGFVVGSKFLADNEWHHIAVVSNGSVTDDIRLYIDGQRDLVSSIASQSVNTSSTDTVKMGVHSGTLRYFSGLLDDIRVYDRALTDEEVWGVATRNSTDLACPDMDLNEGVGMGDYALVAENWNRTLPPLLINEIMADNEGTLSTHVDGEVDFPDWIELYNSSSAPIDLTGWYLTDNASDLTKWPFPAGLTIGSGEYLVVFASGRTQADRPENYPFVDDDGSWHTNFKLTSDGEYLAVVAGTPPAVVHAYDTYDPGNGDGAFPPQREDISYGVQFNEFRYFAFPTPGSRNGGGFLGFAAKPDFSYDAGFYDAPFKLIMTAEMPQDVIRYTTDGSEPTETTGVAYTGPVSIDTTVCVRAKAFRAGFRPSKSRTASYLFNVSDAVKSLPVVSIVGDEQKSLFEPDGIMAIVGGYYNGGVWTASNSGDYNNPMQRGIAYERPVSVEFLHADGKNDVQVDCGIRVAGSDWHRPRYTRGENWSNNYNKISLKLFFRDSYGKSWFDYNMFPLFPVETFKSVILRGGHNDVNNPFIKDEWIRRLHKDMGRLAAGGTLMNLFINGKYKAYYNPTERLDHDFFRTWYNSDGDWDVITQRAVRNGDYVDFNNMRNFVRNNSMANNANYRRAAEWIDIEDFIDYLIIQLYCCNWDWPQNNWTVARERTANAKWRFYLWDVEGSLSTLSEVRLSQLNGGSGPSGELFRSLKASPDFRQAFADRIQKHFFADGALTRPNLDMRFHQLRRDMSQILPGMNQNILTSWIPNRHNIMMNAFIADGLFWLEGPVLNIDGQPLRGGYVHDGATLTLTKPGGAGTIWYTTDGVDPRLPIAPDQTTTVIVPESAAKRVFVPTTNMNTTWTGGNEPYDDSGWTHGTPPTPRELAGVGYERSSGYQDRISYDVESRLHGNAVRSALIRIPFSVKAQDLAGWNLLTLRMRYDDGFAAYINGRLVHQQNITGTPGSAAGVTSHEDSGQETFPISQHLDALKPGTNILAIHGMNASANSSDFLVLPELLAGRNTPGGGAVAESAKAYTGPINLTKSVRVKARVLNGGTWSALSEDAFVVGALHDSLVISEIMYHPDANSANVEYIELANTGDQPLNLNLVKFTDGVNFEFEDVSLAGGGRTVVVNNRSAFEQAYPDFAGSVAGEYEGALDNAGDKIAVADALGRTIAKFSYEDNWFDITDGGGFSLTRRNTGASLTQGLAAHYKLDEPFGSYVGDCSGNGRNGIVRGMPAWAPFNGKSDGAIQLAGDGGYIGITGYKGILGSQPRTCAAWVKTKGTSVQIMAWGLIGTPGARWIVALDNLGRLRVEFGAGYVAGTRVINDGKWHHVAAVLDGPLTDNLVLYVDGCLDTVSELISRSVDTLAGANVSIGAHPDTPYPLNGLIDNVAIYDRALSAEEVTLLAAAADYWEDKEYWRPSAYVGGSPGADDTGIVPDPGAVVINEILAHSHAMQPDWIELHNTTDAAIDISGWFLSDDEDESVKFRIADGTILAPRGYAVFYEDLHFGNAQNPGCTTAFAFSENGEALYVRSGLDAAGRPTGFYDEEAFGASETGVAFGRYQKSTGACNFVAMSANTPGDDNAYPKVGPIVISEIMYNPLQGAGHVGSEHEYVELHNITASAVTLQEYDPAAEIYLPWRFTDGIDYTFAPNTTIPAGGHLVIAKNPPAFALRYPKVTNVVGPYDGQLANEGEKLELSMPGDTDAEGTRYYIRVDRVNYNDSTDWPQAADGQGMSLIRINNTQYGNDPANWQAADASPGQ